MQLTRNVLQLQLELIFVYELQRKTVFLDFNISLKLNTKKSFLTCKLVWQPSSSKIWTTQTWPLFTAMCNAVCRRLLRAFASQPTNHKYSHKWTNSINIHNYYMIISFLREIYSDYSKQWCGGRFRLKTSLKRITLKNQLFHSVSIWSTKIDFGSVTRWLASRFGLLTGPWLQSYFVLCFFYFVKFILEK